MNPEGIASSNRTPVEPDLGLRARIELFKALHGFGEQNEQPLKSRITTAVKLASGFLGLLATACGDTAVPPTSSTEIVSTTTTPTTQPPPPTTEAPATTTSTTEAPTNTTIPITEPTGDVYNGDNIVAELGIISKTDLGDYGYYTVSARAVALEEMSILDFQGNEEVVYGIKVVFGKANEEGKPYERTFWFGRKFVEERAFTIQYYDFRNFRFTETPGENINKITEENLLALQQAVSENAQIGLLIPYKVSSQYLSDCDPIEVCQYYREGQEYISINQEILNDLQNTSTSGIITSQSETNEFGWIGDIIIFPEKWGSD